MWRILRNHWKLLKIIIKGHLSSTWRSVNGPSLKKFKLKAKIIGFRLKIKTSILLTAYKTTTGESLLKYSKTPHTLKIVTNRKRDKTWAHGCSSQWTQTAKSSWIQFQKWCSSIKHLSRFSWSQGEKIPNSNHLHVDSARNCTHRSRSMIWCRLQQLRTNKESCCLPSVRKEKNWLKRFLLRSFFLLVVKMTSKCWRNAHLPSYGGMATRLYLKTSAMRPWLWLGALLYSCMSWMIWLIPIKDSLMMGIMYCKQMYHLNPPLIIH